MHMNGKLKQLKNFGKIIATEEPLRSPFKAPSIKNYCTSRWLFFLKKRLLVKLVEVMSQKILLSTQYCQIS